jgi:hypothetical protein
MGITVATASQDSGPSIRYQYVGPSYSIDLCQPLKYRSSYDHVWEETVRLYDMAMAKDGWLEKETVDIMSFNEYTTMVFHLLKLEPVSHNFCSARPRCNFSGRIRCASERVEATASSPCWSGGDSARHYGRCIQVPDSVGRTPSLDLPHPA